MIECEPGRIISTKAFKMVLVRVMNCGKTRFKIKPKPFSDGLISGSIEHYLSGSNTVAKNFIMKKYTSVLNEEA